MTGDGVRIAYSTVGSGPPLVFVRGWISHLELFWEDAAFRAFFEAIAEHFTVIRYDMRGNGLSDRDVAGRLSLDELVLDLEAVMDRLGAPDPIVWGNCYGAFIVARYAYLNPDRVSRLILDGAYARGREFAPPGEASPLDSIIQLLRTDPRAAMLLLRHYTSPGQEVGEPDIHNSRQRIDAPVAAELYELAREIDIADDLAAITVPTLVLHRRRSKSVPYHLGQRVAALLPDGRFETLEGSSANLWRERPQEALAAIGRFLDTDLQLPATGGAVVSPPTVVLFTDIEGSTSNASRLGDDVAHERVRVHNRIVATAVPNRGGRVVKSTGDGVMASFPSVSQAIACAIEIQEALAVHNASRPEAAVLVRMGLNAGEPLSEDDDLHGLVVNTAARICAQAEGGGIIVSNVVRELATGKGFRFRDAGEFDLRGLDAPVRLFAVDWR